MKKLLTILFLLLCVKANAQFLPTILQITDTAYLSVNRIGSDSYIAVLTEAGLDIREAGIADFGTQVALLNMPDLNPSASVELMGNYACVINALYNKVSVVDLTNPLAPSITATFSIPSYSIAHAHWGNFLYIPTGSKTYIYSLADPTNPVIVDSTALPMEVIVCSGDNVYTISSIRSTVYHWLATDTAPYLSLHDSISTPNTFLAPSIAISGTQLLLKNSEDSLYRFRIALDGMLSRLTAEQLPGYVYNGKLIARDTNILGYVLYNSMFASRGTTGNSFVDSAKIPVDGNYTISSGLLDNNIYYTNGVHTYLISFPGATGIETIPEQLTFNVYPNPANNIITLSLSSNNNKLHVDIMDLNGRVEMQQNIKGESGQIDVSTLSPGNYILYLFNEQKTVGVKKITKI